MKIFEKITFFVLFVSMFLMLISSFFFDIIFFDSVFGLSFITMSISSLALASVELAIGDLFNPYESDDYYID